MIQQAIEILVSGRSLSTEEASGAMVEIMNGDATPAQLGSFITALRMKGETVEEVSGMAQVMREKALRIDVEGPIIDTCGTGGDGSGTFNISTSAGLVLAGAGLKVAKHGNRAMSSACGSADVLEALGVRIDLSPAGVTRCLEEVGFGFMFAQVFHPSMRFAAGVRREIGIRTVFNILGPLTNPAHATMQIIGVASPHVGEMIAEVLGVLGSVHALVVHGHDGLDEISLSGTTKIWELKNGRVTSYILTPEEMGFGYVSRASLEVSGAKESSQLVLDVLDGICGPARDVVLANTAGALVAAGKVKTIKEGVAIAVESIDSRSAKDKLQALIELSQNLE